MLAYGLESVGKKLGTGRAIMMVAFDVGMMRQRASLDMFDEGWCGEQSSTGLTFDQGVAPDDLVAN